MDVNQLKAALKRGRVTINFTKVNGDRRVMVATLDPNLLPPPHPEKSNKTTNPNLIVVFDTDHAGWRSIKLDSIADWVEGVSIQAQAPVTPPTIGWSPNPAA